MLVLVPATTPLMYNVAVLPESVMAMCVHTLAEMATELLDRLLA